MGEFNREYYLLLCLSGRSEEATAYMNEFKRGEIKENGGFKKENETVQADGAAPGNAANGTAGSCKAPAETAEKRQGAPGA